MNDQPSLLMIAKNIPICADSIGKNKQGHIVFRFGFYYTNGRNASMMADLVCKEFAKVGVAVTVIELYEKWLPFKGSAPVARQSHWGVVVKKAEQVNIELN